VDQSALRREVAPQKNLAPDNRCEVGPFGILSLQKRTEARTGDQIMLLLIGNMMKTARSFPVSHEFPFSPTRRSRAYCIASQVDATITPMTKGSETRDG
jgi:hypothetical protein